MLQETGISICKWFLAVWWDLKLLQSGACALEQFFTGEIKCRHTGHFCTNCTIVEGNFEPQTISLSLVMFVLLQNHYLHSEHLEKVFVAISTEVEMPPLKKLRSQVQSSFMPWRPFFWPASPKKSSQPQNSAALIYLCAQVWMCFLNCLVQKCCCDIVNNKISLCCTLGSPLSFKIIKKTSNRTVDNLAEQWNS